MTGHAEGLNIFLKAIETFKMDEEDDASPIPTELSDPPTAEKLSSWLECGPRRSLTGDFVSNPGS